MSKFLGGRNVLSSLCDLLRLPHVTLNLSYDEAHPHKPRMVHRKQSQPGSPLYVRAVCLASALGRRPVPFCDVLETSWVLFPQTSHSGCLATWIDSQPGQSPVAADIHLLPEAGVAWKPTPPTHPPLGGPARGKHGDQHFSPHSLLPTQGPFCGFICDI